MLWTEKFKPALLSDFVGNPEIVKQVKEWAIAWSAGKKQKPLLFWGQTGIGKTLLAELIAKQMNWQLFELNASDFRTKEIIERVAGAAALNASFTGSLRLVLLDEIDGLQGTADKGGSAAVSALLKQASQPVVLTANEVFGDVGKKISSIKSQCIALEFKKPHSTSITKFLQKVCEFESIDFDLPALNALAKNSNSDLRSALLDLQSIAEHSKKIILQEVEQLGFRERQQRVFEVLQKVFHAKTIQESQQARLSSDLDSEMLLRWIEENIPRHFTQEEDTASAFNALSRADVFNGRIFKRQHYGFLRYSSELMTSGVALKRKHSYPGFVRYQFPKLLSMLSKSTGLRSKRKEIAEKMKSKMRGSKKRIMSEDLAFLQPLFQNNETLTNFTALFGFDSADLAFLTGKKADSKFVEKILQHAEELRRKTIVKKNSFFKGANSEDFASAETGFTEDFEEFKKQKIAELDKSQTKLF